MRKLALLPLLLFVVSLCAQTAKPSPAVSAIWQVTPTATVQYDPTVWKLGTMDNSQVLLLMNEEKVPRPDVALNVTIIPATDVAAADIIASRIAATEDKKDVTTIVLKEYRAGEEYGVLFAYTAQSDKGVEFLIGRWSFAGDKLDIKSQSVVEFEGVIPVSKENDDIMKKMDAVIQTYRIK